MIIEELCEEQKNIKEHIEQKLWTLGCLNKFDFLQETGSMANYLKTLKWGLGGEYRLYDDQMQNELDECCKRVKEKEYY